MSILHQQGGKHCGQNQQSDLGSHCLSMRLQIV